MAVSKSQNSECAKELFLQGHTEPLEVRARQTLVVRQAHHDPLLSEAFSIFKIAAKARAKN